MQQQDIHHVNSLKPATWFRKPANRFLIGVIAATVLLYLISPIIELFQ